MKTFKQFVNESMGSRRSQRASKMGRTSKRSAPDNNPRLIYTIGEPATGKSSFARHIQSKTPDTVDVSLDASRKALGKHPAYYGKDIAAHQDAGIRSAKKDVIVSNTSIPKQHRQALERTAKEQGKTPVPVVLPTSSKTANRRNRNRPVNAAPGEGRVPRVPMDSMSRGMRGTSTRPHVKALSRKDKREARKNFKKLHKEYRFTKPAMQRSGAIPRK